MSRRRFRKPVPLTQEPAILRCFRQEPRDPAPPKAHTTGTESPSTELDDGGAEDHDQPADGAGGNP